MSEFVKRIQVAWHAAGLVSPGGKLSPSHLSCQSGDLPQTKCLFTFLLHLKGVKMGQAATSLSIQLARLAHKTR